MSGLDELGSKFLERIPYSNITIRTQADQLCRVPRVV